MGGLVKTNVQIDYAPLKDVLPLGAGFSDIDGVLEHHGHFLFIETKFERAPLSRGQEIMLKHLRRMPNTQVWVVSIKKSPTLDVPGLFYFHPEAIQIINADGTMTNWESCDLACFKMIYQAWWDKSSTWIRKIP